MTAGSINRLLDTALLRPFRLSAPDPNCRKIGCGVALKIRHGLHAGAALDLAEPLYTVGSSTKSDIVLRDTGIAPVHACLRRKGDQMEVEAVGGDVTLASGEVVPKGHGRRCKLPVEVIFGEAQVLLTGPERASAGSPVARRPILVAAGLVAAVFVLSVAANGLSLAEFGPVPARRRRRREADQTRLHRRAPAICRDRREKRDYCRTELR